MSIIEVKNSGRFYSFVFNTGFDPMRIKLIKTHKILQQDFR